MGSAPGGQCLDGPCSRDWGMTQGPPTGGRCRSGPAWTLAEVVTGQGPALVATPRVWRGLRAHGPALCCPPAAALGTAGRRDRGLHSHTSPPTQGSMSLGQTPPAPTPQVEPPAWTRGHQPPTPPSTVLSPSLALSYAAKALPWPPISTLAAKRAAVA